MATDIKCPKCGHQFDIEDAVSEEYKKELREQMVAYKKQVMEESAKKNATRPSSWPGKKENTSSRPRPRPTPIPKSCRKRK
ncbi:hypothetical protein [Paraflavitalea speifideaquila]|uniref:hypothetical protein n=1 Tax=Paraflavitalea speifideaquila TaxID=3076558 RepID=UPI0028E9A435|nr:hypothetical protein [Paraflavitalea speifideiaquila]